MTLTQTFIPYKRHSGHDAQIAQMDWDLQPELRDMYHYPVFRDMFPTLDSLILRNRSPGSTHVDGGTFICYDPSDLNRRLSPDFYVSFGVDTKAIRDRSAGYLIWEAGKPPDFALEVASPTTARNDSTHKKDIYGRIGITEYWLFDPSGGDLYDDALAGYELVGGAYEPMSITTEPDGHRKGFSKVLGLTLCWQDGAFRVFDEITGDYVLSPIDQALRIEEQDALIADQRNRIDHADAQIRQLETEIARLRSKNNGTGR